jgi:general nucleoside transport system permease protein
MTATTVSSARSTTGLDGVRAALARNTALRLGVYGLAIFVLLAVVRLITGADDLTSAGTFAAAVRLGTPIGLVGLAALISERVGVLNIGLDANMVLGTWFAGWAGYEMGPWAGVVGAAVGGLIGALLHAVLTIHLRIDQVMSGVVMIILAPAVTRFLSAALWDGRQDAAASLGPPIDGDLPRFTIPFLAGGRIGSWESPDIFGWIAKKGWFVISDIAGVVKGATNEQSVLVYFALLAFPMVWFMLYRTRFGLRLRSSGESPSAADSLGVNVYATRYAGVLLSGVLSGLAGAILVLATGSNQYKEGQVAGRGFIGIAAMIFGNWRPGGLAVGSGLFGFADALQLRSADSVKALLLLIAIVCGLAAINAAVKRRVVAFIVSLVIGVGFFVWWLTTDEVAQQFTVMTPYVVTLVVLVVAAQSLRPPRAAGTPWSKSGG